jgi:predicted dehydrogenase
MLELSLMSVRVGIVGLGGVADRIHLPACAAVPEIEVAGAADPNPAARQAMGLKFKIAETFDNYEQMLEKIKPEVVIVGTPPGSHYEICSKSMDAGAHVFCEKPFMPSVEDADRIIAAARAKNKLLRVNNQYRFMSYYAETKRRLLAGEFGRPYYLQCWQQMFHPPAKETNWRNQLSQYVLFEFGTHALDLACFFFDALPDAITVHTPRVRADINADVLVHATMRFPEERLAAFSFNRVTHAPEKYLEMRIDCENASLRISLGGVARLSIDWAKNAGRFVVKHGFVRGGQARAEVNGVPHVYSSSKQGEFAAATAEHLKYFLTEMRDPKRTLEGAEHARDVLRLVFAGYESANRGETVWLNPHGKPQSSHPQTVA